MWLKYSNSLVELNVPVLGKKQGWFRTAFSEHEQTFSSSRAPNTTSVQANTNTNMNTAHTRTRTQTHVQASASAALAANNPGSWIQDPGTWIQDPGSWIQDPGCRIQEQRTQQNATRTPNTEHVRTCSRTRSDSEHRTQHRTRTRVFRTPNSVIRQPCEKLNV